MKIFSNSELSKKLQKARLHFENFRQKLVVRNWGLAKRLDQSHSKDEARKPKSNQR